ncbi:MAG: sulfatase [Planctomycetaceae bacterium]|nr:sulfatase [Planctomycetaceae bacterium]
MPVFRLIFCLFAVTACLSCHAAVDAKPLNVLFLICDDLNCDLGCYGNNGIESPTIDKLAAQGVRFDRAYCQYPLCGPSRASFMTGMYPDQTLIHRNAIYVREHTPNVVTLAQMFRNNGYLATRIGKIYHYNVPLHIGTSGHDDPYSWDITINPRGRDVIDQDQIFTLTPGSYGGTLSWLSADGTDQEQTDGIAADEAIRQLNAYAETEQPFFLAVGLYRPHTPYVAPHDYFKRYPVSEISVPRITQEYLDTLPAPAVKTIHAKKHQIDLEESLARQAIQAYHASITFADAQVGRILEGLEKSGLADNTVVVFTSDHGYHMGEHGHWQKMTLFENATRVPLIMKGPGVSDIGATVSTPVEMADIYPTLADLCGLKAPKTVQGISLQAALQDAEKSPRTSALSQCQSGYSLRTGKYRYTEWGLEGADGAELYDESADPGEMTNLADSPQYSEIRKQLSRQLHDRIAAAQVCPPGLKQIQFENNRQVPK